VAEKGCLAVTRTVPGEQSVRVDREAIFAVLIVGGGVMRADGGGRAKMG
jgi:hypothetical protein